ncbi:MAG: LUD domain-containing protein [Clostridiaceae bacterium]|nr:LUD domain-containing protein [Clostridiaceae bacterium]
MIIAAILCALVITVIFIAYLKKGFIAAPKDTKRLNKETPCTKLGNCIDCKHEQRICNDFVLIARQFDKERIKVIIVNQPYGY